MGEVWILFNIFIEIKYQKIKKIIYKTLNKTKTYYI